MLKGFPFFYVEVKYDIVMGNLAIVSREYSEYYIY